MKSSLRIIILVCLQLGIFPQAFATLLLHNHVPAEVAHLQPVDRLAPSRELRLALSLPLRNKEGLTNLLQRIYDPASPDFHHYLTPAQFAASFGPTQADYDTVKAFAISNGLKVTATHSNRSLLDVTGSVANIEKAFHLTMRTYRHPREKRDFYAPDAEPSLDVMVPIMHISGLDNFLLPQPMSLRITPQTASGGTAPASGSGPNGAYMGNDFRAAYVPGSPRTGAGQSIGLLEFDGYYPNDISAYASVAGVPAVPLNNVYLDGFNGTPGNNNVEVALDIDLVIAMAPGLSSVIVYEGEVTDDILNRMATDDLASQLAASWSYPITAATDQIFQQFAAQGQSFFNAAGDDDAWVGQIATPCDDPNLTSVGGTTLTTSGPGGAWVSETVWNWGIEFGSAYNGKGSGGGISTVYPIPSWQLGVNMSSNQGSAILRNIPDVALTADNIFVIANNGQQENVGGTSCAVQLWAAFVALANEQAAASGRPPVGFLNPALYALGLSVNYTNGFHDITTGNNAWSQSPVDFYAVPGYDLCTGWGTPVGAKLINLLVLDSLQISPPGGLAASGSAGGPLTPASQSYTLADGGDATVVWAAAATVPWLNVSLNGGILTPGGPATTVVVSLNAAAGNLFPGAYSATVWFTNLTDGGVQSRAVSLAIVKPPAILTQPASLAAIGGTTANFTAVVAGGLPLACQWRSNGVNMIDGGRVSGSQTNLTNAGNIYGSVVSTLTISNLAAADAATYVLVASNAAGVKLTTEAVLTVPPSGPVIVQQPASQAVLVGDTVKLTVAADGTPPFTYQWRQNETNLADGAAVSGSATPALTLSNASSASIGTYTVVVSNALGAATSTGAVVAVEVATPAGWVSADGPPIIAIQPRDQIALPGGAATFSVLSSGTFPLLYQWQFDGVNIDDATNATLTLANLATNQAGAYGVLVSNSLGSTASSNALLQVLTGNQETITFDDLPYRLLPVPAGYGNLTWSNFYYLNGAANRSSGYQAGVISVPKAAYNGNGFPAALSAPTLFALTSAYLTAAWNDNLQVGVKGYNASVLSYDNTYTLSAATPTLIAFNYVGVTSVQFISYGGAHHAGYNGNGTEFVLDNVNARVQPLPPPPPPTPLTVLYSFDGFDGGYPSAPLIQGADGYLYGTTEYGGTNGDGTIFRMTTNGVLTTLVSLGKFNANPLSALMQAADGNFYGTTEHGGRYDNGTIFRLTTSGVFSTLVSFNYALTGGYPSSALVEGNDGNLYGTAEYGGSNDVGTAFRLTTNGEFTTLTAFDFYATGGYPTGSLLLGADGNFYGTASSGGADGAGTAFRLAADGTFSLLLSFNGLNAFPAGSLVQGADGLLYGITEYGGTNNSGTVFSLTTNGVISTLASFNTDLTGGAPSAGLVQGADGSFYGTTPSGGTFGTTYFGGTFGAGTVFNVTTNGALTVLLAFQCTNGLFSQAALMQASDGNFYGTTAYGGDGFDGFYNGGDGIVFRLGAPSPAAPPAVVTQPVSQNVPIGGTASFHVHAGGLPPLSYAWQRNGNPIAGANEPIYSTTNVQSSDSEAQFTCIISNAFGSATTSSAALSVFSASGPLFSFHGPDGAWPFSTLVPGLDGAFYGTTEYGGTNGNGTVFRVTTNGTFSTLASFNFYVTGGNPSSSLLLGTDGNFYGTTTFGGTQGVGTVFSLSTNGVLTTLVSFNGANGSDLYGALVEGADGNFYGTTYYGGAGGEGTVFEVTKEGELTTLATFSGSNGAYPQGGLVEGGDGTFYGTTYYGGSNGFGSVFRLTTNGVLTTLVSFDGREGAYPQGTLVEGADGNYYGTTEEGGAYGEGTVFRLTTNGGWSSLQSFAGTNGAYPSGGLVAGSDGNYYGTTTEGGADGEGTVFSLATNGVLSSLQSFAGANGSYPSGGLVEGSDGNYYGTTVSGGVGYDGVYWSGNGTVFRLAGAVTAETPLVVSQPAGQTVPVGSGANFGVSATSSTPVSYAWQRNGVNIAGATQARYAVHDAQLSDSGSLFRCVVSNPYGAIASSNALLTVVPPVGPPPPPAGPPALPLTVLYTFNGFDGGHPTAALVRAADGSFYGTTASGGNAQCGVAFRLTTNGTLTPLVSFDNTHGAHPSGALAAGEDGRFYGMTTAGGAYGNGTVFSLTTNGALTTLLSFNDANGASPNGALTLGDDGRFYGTTTEGGADGEGTAFSLTTNGVLSSLLSFNGANGAYPNGGLALGKDGQLYGTTEDGGTNDAGTIFSLSTNGVLSTLAAFEVEETGGYPVAALVEGTDGSFYGTTEYGGENGDGTIFRLTPNEPLAVLFSFDNTQGAEPSGALVEGGDGRFYGTTEYGGASDNGTIFSLSTNGAVTSLYSFGSTNGLYPQAGLVEGADGNLYGTATEGGEGFNGANVSGDGVVFRLGGETGAAAPWIIAQPASPIVPVGGAAIFRVNAGGAAPLSYAWQRNGHPIAGAVESVYLTNNVQPADAGDQFSCVIRNANGTATTASASLTVFNVAGPVYSFAGPDGGYPSSALIEGTDGAFYGTTEYGGTDGNGTIYRLTTNGLLTTLVSFDQIHGAQPGAALVEGSDHNFYGTSTAGGTYEYGTVFSLTTNGVLTTLASFDNANGAHPAGALVEGMDGNFYGTTYYGGAAGEGTAFEVNREGELTTLATFSGSNGAYPQGGLVEGGEGTFYGTTYYGGSNGFGSVFRLTTNGVLTTLVSFDGREGAYPQGTLVEGADGNYYGTTEEGGAYGEGTVFRLTTNGGWSSLQSFAGTNGAYPSGGLVAGSDGNYYGTTTEGGADGEGTVFSLATNGVLSSLQSFAGANGSYPSGGLVEGSDGNYYGTTVSGGVGYDGVYWSGNGTVFRLAGAVTAETPLVVSQPAGQTVPVGSGANFGVSATSSTPVSYAWQRNGVNIAGATQARYAVHDAQLSDSGSLFRCVVSNPYGAIASSNALLTVVPPVGPPPPPAGPPALPLTVLYTFNGFDGGHPTAALVRAADGSFYGTTASGGNAQCGVAFRLTTNGTLTPLVSFDNTHGAHPSGALAAGEDGRFYGMTTAGGAYGNGTVFSLTTNGALTTLLSFNDANGASPNGALTLGDDGRFYGTTTEGGADGEGTAFSLTTNGVLSSLLSFNGANGAYPNGGLALGKDGQLYGTTEDGGTNDAGTIFSLSTNGVLSTLAAFEVEETGGYPVAALVEGTDGSFYGTTEYGGENGDGTIFRLTPNEPLAVLFSFDNTQGAEPSGALVEGGDGRFYGTTEYGGASDNGTIFSLSTNGAVTSLYSFGSTNGLYPQAGLVEGADGNLYGTATEGGEGFNGANVSGDGVVFRLGGETGAAAPWIIAQPASPIVPVGGAAIFRVNAGGAAPLSYAWQRNGHPIAGAVESVYLTNNVQPADAGDQFSCVIRNANGTATTASASLTVFNVAGPVYSFAGPDGGYPSSALIEGTDGAFYGTTEYGGTDGNGTIYRLTTNGLLTTLVSFDQIHGAQPGAALVEGSDHNFYGTSTAGGTYEYGTVFSLTTNGVLTTLASFDNANGAHPAGALVEGMDGNFYGTTYYGGAAGEGTAFEVNREGELTTLATFSGSNGAYPQGGLVEGGEGTFYGTTYYGGSNGFGSVFRLTTNGVLTTLVSFDGREGAYPQGTLVEGADGNYYGTTEEGGAYGEGTVFRLTTNGGWSSLQSFAGTNGAYPSGGLVAGSDGNYYGTTTEGGADGEGTVFSLATNGVLSSLQSFAGANGSYPSGGLVEGSDGNYYGTTVSGGVGYDGVYWSGNGTVFRLAGAVTAETPLVVSQPAGQTVPVGSGANFGVSATSSTPVSYAWQRNGVNIAGATQARYAVHDAQLSDSGSLFRCVVSNPYGAIASSNASLTVTLPSLVQNGGFELGTFADWTSSGNFEDCSVTSTTPNVHYGNYGAEMGPIGSPGYISQTLATSAGEEYLVSCWLFSDGQTPNEFSISWNGAIFFDQQNIGGVAWTNLQFYASTSSTNTVLTFGFLDNPSYLGLDDVAVYPIGVAPLQLQPPQLQSATLAKGIITLIWSAEAGRTYEVQCATNLAQPAWISVDGPFTATHSTISISEPIGANNQQFYRSVAHP